MYVASISCSMHHKICTDIESVFGAVTFFFYMILTELVFLACLGNIIRFFALSFSHMLFPS